MNVVTILGCRPEIIRLSRIIPAFDKVFNHTLIHTAQSYDYELSEIFFKEMEIRIPDYFLEAGGSPAETVGKVIVESDKILRKINPDAVFILGDTNSSLAAYSAKRLKIPVFHYEAGNRCFDERTPEEINRKIIDHIADINLPYSERSRENLMREGISTDRIIKVGSPMYEVLSYYRQPITFSSVLSKLKLKSNFYFVVSLHREENMGELNNFIRMLDSLASVYGLPVIVSTHPRTRKALGYAIDNIYPHSLVRFMPPLGFFDYIHLQQNAHCTLSDSGTISEESSILGFPALNLREVHERQEAMEESAVMMTGLNWNRIDEALSVLPKHQRVQIPSAYCASNVSEKIVRIIQSYTDYVNRKVWSK